ncbi:response regulator transcription factor [Streptomyces sp. MBT62]|nr:response regulator transcription factor [Streptomyces sp. MBT62]
MGVGERGVAQAEAELVQRGGAQPDIVPGLWAALTEREREVAEGLADGLSNQEIAAALHMSVATVKAHVTRLLRELGLNNRTQVALLAYDARADR